MSEETTLPAIASPEIAQKIADVGTGEVEATADEELKTFVTDLLDQKFGIFKQEARAQFLHGKFVGGDDI